MTGRAETTDDPWGPVPSGERWSSGRWALDLRGDELADIRCDGEVVLRGVRAVARDVDWRTAWPREVAARSTAQALVLDVVIEDLGIDLAATVTVRADQDSLEVTLDAEVRADSRTNRTGLVVLHPPSLAGEDLVVGHSDGSRESLRFPVHISPHQPARGISSLTWSARGTRFRIDLAGDVFEMEDQRNWSDASYKTYNRSLDEPFPYTLRAGEHVRQRVTLTASEAAEAPGGSRPGPDALDLTAAGPFPTIAVGASTAPDPGPARPDPVSAHRHVELELTDPAWPAALERARLGARDLAVLIVSPVPADPAVLADVVARLEGADLRWMAIVDDVSHVSEPELVAALRASVPAGVPVVGGSRSHFTEVNREWHRLPHQELDGLVFPITPMFHTLETEQLVESVAMQRVIAHEATTRAPGTPVHIGPVTLRPRFDNVATTPPPAPTRTDLAEGYGAERTGQCDPRQGSEQLAAWTIASAAALAVPGVASLAYLEQWGPRGIRTADGTDLPVRSALEALTALAGSRLLSAASPDGWLWAIGGRWDGGDGPAGVESPDGSDGTPGPTGPRNEILIANVSGRSREVELSIEGGAPSRLELGAFAWTRISSPVAERSSP